MALNFRKDFTHSFIYADVQRWNPGESLGLKSENSIPMKSPQQIADSTTLFVDYRSELYGFYALG